MTTTLTKELTTPRTHLDAFSEVERTLPGHDRPAIARLRKAAIARFGELGFPGERDEDWKFTSVAPLVRTPMQLARGDCPFVPTSLRSKGVLIDHLENALERHPQIVEAHLGQHGDFKANPFVALNTAFWRDGVFLYVPDGVVIEEPIRLGYLLTPTDEPAGRLWYRRILVVVGARSQVTLVEPHEGPAVRYAVNAVSEIVLGEGAVVDHYKVQEESAEAFHLATTQVVVPAKANFSTHYVGFGGAIARNEVRVKFTGSHAEATVNGLYLANGSQHMDNHTVIDHALPHCASHELYKGILDGKARGVFNGKIFVRLDAQKTDAKQTNKTLLLSDDATINTKPQLEIFADDVKCTHGATVGQLDEQQLFYLRSRGVGAEQAKALLTFAFANDIVGRVKVPSLRQRLESALLEASHLPRLEEDE
ncbi:MAG: Fe-S cluster assembly protein SufD [Gemmataceae bacterium]